MATSKSVWLEETGPRYAKRWRTQVDLPVSRGPKHEKSSLNNVDPFSLYTSVLTCRCPRTSIAVTYFEKVRARWRSTSPFQDITTPGASDSLPSIEQTKCQAEAARLPTAAEEK